MFKMTLALFPLGFLFPKETGILEKNSLRRNIVTRRRTVANSLDLSNLPLSNIKRRSRSIADGLENICDYDTESNRGKISLACGIERSKSQSRLRPIGNDESSDSNNNNITHDKNEVVAMRYLETSNVAADEVIALHWDADNNETVPQEQDELRGNRSASFAIATKNPKRKVSRSCLSVPCVGSLNSDSPHLYTPYFYLPHQTSYENDQDLVIVNQPLDEMFLRANYFELKQLARAGFDFKKADRHGNTPLHYAAKRGDANIVRLVMSEGGCAWAHNLDKRTPFELASNLTTAMLLADSTLFYGEKGESEQLEGIQVCYEL